MILATKAPPGPDPIGWPVLDLATTAAHPGPPRGVACPGGTHVAHEAGPVEHGSVSPASPVTSSIHPTAVVGPGVQLGTGVSVGPHAVLTGPLEVGDRAWIGAGAVVGAPPEITSARMNLAWTGDLDHAGVVLEADVVVREHVVVHQGSHRATRVGAGTWLLNRAYLAHDVLVGAGVVVSAGVSIGGHAVVGDRANLGMNASVHQRRVVGAGAMVGMGTPVTRDVPPFALVHGSPVRLHGVNAYALDRRGLPAEVVAALAEAYRGDLRSVPADGALAALAAELTWWAGLEDVLPVRPVRGGRSVRAESAGPGDA